MPELTADRRAGERERSPNFDTLTWPQMQRAVAAGAEKIYLEPVGILRGAAAAMAVANNVAAPLTGGPAAFTAARVWLRRGEIRPAAAVATVTAAVATAADVSAWAAERQRLGDPRAATCLAALTRQRSQFAGLDLDRAGPRIMAVINVTPDSFSDGGDYADADAAIARGLQARSEGADILDIGGESTRPGALPIDVEEEKRRVLPVVSALAKAGAIVSIDTSRAGVMRAAIAAGARIVNDVSALTGDNHSLAVVAEARVPIVLMHMQGAPGMMQDDPTYIDVTLDIFDYLAERIDACESAGIRRDDICIDPGIGFGKTVKHNLELLARLSLLHGLGCPLLLGVSRKSFIARLAGEQPAKQRLPGSLAAGLDGAAAGAQLIRVHDVLATAQALRIWRARNAVG